MMPMDTNKSSGGPVSFVQGVKDIFFGTVSEAAAAAPEIDREKADLARQLDESRQELRKLKAAGDILQSKWALMTKDFDDAGSVGREIKKIDDRKKELSNKISQREERIKGLYAGKDARLKELEIARASLKNVLKEKRSVEDGSGSLKKHEREIEELKKQLAEAGEKEEAVGRELEEIEVRLRFANANTETLVLDSATAKKTLDDLDNIVRTKKEAIESARKAKSSVDDVYAKMGDLKAAKDRAVSVFQAFKRDTEDLQKVRGEIKRAEDERSAIPGKVAELTAGKNILSKDARERAALIKREKTLTSDVERLKADEKRLVEQAGRNKSVLEKVEKIALDVKRLMMAAGLSDLASGVDSSSMDALKRSVERKGIELVDSMESHKKELARAQNEQSQKEATLTRMTRELDKLMSEAERDKRDVGRQREGTRKIKEQTSALRSSLEAKLREKSAAMSEVVSVSMEMKRIEALEADAVKSIRRIEADTESVDRTVADMLAALRTDKEQLGELTDMQGLLGSRLDMMNDMASLKVAEKELALAREMVAKYEADLRRLSAVERQKALLEEKLALADEAPVPIPVMESRLAALRGEESRLEEEIKPLRSEIGRAFEKRDNLEMELSFAKEGLKRAADRKKSLERKLDFITKESGSVKNVQDKLAACEGRLMSAEKNVAEIQTRLGFTAATEDVVKERLQGAQGSLEKIDKEIEGLGAKAADKEASLSELRTKLAGHESTLDGEKSGRIEAEIEKASCATEIKRIAIECDALIEKSGKLEASLKELKSKASDIEEAESSCEKSLEERKGLGKDIETLGGEVDKAQSGLDDVKSKISDLQDKKRDLMEKSLGSDGEAASAGDKGADSGRVDTLRAERKAVREKIKETDTEIKKLKASAEGSDDKEKARADAAELRAERDGLRKKIDDINAQIDAAKEEGGGGEAVSAGKGDAGELAKSIGQMDIKVMGLSKDARKLETELSKKNDKLAKLTAERDELDLEIEKQKGIIAPLSGIKKKISALEKELDAAGKSLEEKKGRRESLARKAEKAVESMEKMVEAIGAAQSAFNRTKEELIRLESDAADMKKSLDEAAGNRGFTLAEVNRLRAEMDSILTSNRADREAIENEKSAAESARKKVEDTRKQLSDAMTILTGKGGSVDSLKLEAVSASSEEKDAGDRIQTLDHELKSALASIDGIESALEPKAARMRYVVWARGVIEGKVRNMRLRSDLDDAQARLRELEEARLLFDEYGDLTKTREELSARVGSLKSNMELETAKLFAEQARHEADARADELGAKLRAQEEMAESLEEKYKAAQEDKVRIKGALDDLTRRFESAKTMWGRVEDLSRMKDSLELKINGFKEKVGAMERVGARIERLESDKAGLGRRIETLETKCGMLEDEKRILEKSLAKSRAEFESAYAILKKSTDEARRSVSKDT